MSPVQHSTSQKNEHTLNVICEQSKGQMTKCDSTQIIRFSLTMRYHINAE